MDYIIYFAITIGILVFIHEFGHFAAAKLSGMRADVFAIGFGKRLFGWNKKSGFSFGELPKDFDGEGHTDYRLCLLPLGGYVKIAGMVDESMDAEFADRPPQPWEFRAKPLLSKVFVITAGVIMNLLLAWLIFWGSNFFQGKPFTETTTIAFVEANSLADSLGFRSGDKILSINGKQVNNWEDVRNEIFINTLGEDLNISLLRNNETISLSIPRNRIPDDETQAAFLLPEGVKPAVGEVLKDSPAQKAGFKPNDILVAINNEPVFTPKQVTQLISSNKGSEITVKVLRDKDTTTLAVVPNDEGKIGVAIGTVFTGKVHYKTYGFFESFYYGWLDIVRMTDLTFSMLGKVFSGNIEFKKAFGGPIKIAQYAAKSADSGLSSFLYFLALLSLSLAILNIMPFPVLDGGHLVMIVVEAIIGKEIPVKIKLAIQQVGMVLLLLLMAFIVYNDILSL
ncbi:MAG: RIP metalloprotease RseP [Ignavibacterium album]|jgi:regulator of sigma E protease|uniref:RIP metalloprotease RseP n=1 Tax=Ignavibacterium album TaxID=591197 RepID=UPI0026EA2BB5|nr:RIP metalloprotease RseP [Ignavibacterium album]MCX8105060.1 RIP metalloprotease RseP [Ignavibacterium album]